MSNSENKKTRRKMKNNNCHRRKKILMQKTIFLALGFLPLLSADVCGFHASLIGKEDFYLTQPFQKNISIDLQDYFSTFDEITAYKDLFVKQFSNYSTNARLDSLEPFPLIPYSYQGSNTIFPCLQGMFLKKRTTCEIYEFNQRQT